MYIKNCRNSSIIKLCSSYELHRSLKDVNFEIGNFSYTNRYPLLMKTEIDNRKIWNL